MNMYKNSGMRMPSPFDAGQTGREIQEQILPAPLRHWIELPRRRVVAAAESVLWFTAPSHADYYIYRMYSQGGASLVEHTLNFLSLPPGVTVGNAVNSEHRFFSTTVAAGGTFNTIIDSTVPAFVIPSGNAVYLEKAPVFNTQSAVIYGIAEEIRGEN